jgi:hypothetical protein
MPAPHPAALAAAIALSWFVVSPGGGPAPASGQAAGSGQAADVSSGPAAGSGAVAGSGQAAVDAPAVGSAATADRAAISPRWVQSTTPAGGFVAALAQAPSSPQILYAGTEVAGVWRSTDGGASWKPANQGFPATVVQALAVDPRDPDTVLAGTYARNPAESLLRSRDGGATWTKVGPPAALEVTCLLFDAGARGVAYAAVPAGANGRGSGLYRTVDHGATWQLLAFRRQSVTSVVVDPGDTAVLFVTELGSGVWKSADRGVGWTLVLPQVDLVAVKFDPARPGTLYALANQEGSIWRSSDGGASWDSLPLPFTLSDLAASPTGVLFAATASGVQRSTDGGASWLAPVEHGGSLGVPPFDFLVRVLVSTASPDVVYATGREGAWRSQDSGAVWKPSSAGIVAQSVASLDATSGGLPAVYAATGSGVFRRGNRGESWQRTHADESARPRKLLAAAPSDAQRLYGEGLAGAGYYSLTRSDDGGRSWQALPSAPATLNCGVCTFAIEALAVDPVYSGIVYIGGESFFGEGHPNGPFLFRSGDAGASWQEAAAFFGSGSAQVSFTPVALAVDPRRASTLYALADIPALLRSRDAGRSWEQIGSGLPAIQAGNDARLLALALDPAHPGVLYVGTAVHGVYRSGDGGATFEPMNRGLADAPVSALIVDPGNPARLFAGTYLNGASRGVWQWDPDAQSWTPLNDGLPVDALSGPLALDPRRPAVLLAGTDGRGIYRLELDAR